MNAGSVRAFAPGRVNLIGEHTDYNAGLCLPFAIERGVTVTATATGAAEIESEERLFVPGVVGELERAGVRLPGARLEIGADLPRGAGLGSSAALSVGLCLALVELAGRPDALDRVALARLCARVENEWVGAPTGLLDQIAVLFGEHGRALRLDMRTLEIEPVALELEGWVLALLDAGEDRKLRASGYGERRTECTRACRELGVESLRETSAEHATSLPAPLDRRVRHVVSENSRVEEMVRALAAADFARAGALLDASHASLRNDFEVSTPAVEATIERARAAGAAGARIHGGGFGGQVLALFPAGADLPDDATEVTPGGGARIL